MGLYPVLYESETETTPDSQSYRLQHISEIQHRLKKEQEIRASLYKKYHRGENACDGFETALAAVGLGLGASGIGLLSTVIAAPVVVGLEAAAGVCGLAAVISKFIARRLRVKGQKTQRDSRSGRIEAKHDLGPHFQGHAGRQHFYRGIQPHSLRGEEIRPRKGADSTEEEGGE